jgi:hypothetical protein
MISDADIARMTEACRALPEPVGDYAVDDYLTNLVATVVDFQTHTTAVERALEHFSTRVRPALDELVLRITWSLWAVSRRPSSTCPSSRTPG